MFAPGIVGVVMGLLILVGVRDSPESAGYLPVEVVKEKKKADGTPEKKESLVDLLINDCLKYVLFCISFFITSNIYAYPILDVIP